MSTKNLLEKTQTLSFLPLLYYVFHSEYIHILNKKNFCFHNFLAGVDRPGPFPLSISPAKTKTVLRSAPVSRGSLILSGHVRYGPED